ncbi:MAG: CocE/NonD family hydrolase [Gemmatimonadota bacterium]
MLVTVVETISGRMVRAGVLALCLLAPRSALSAQGVSERFEKRSEMVAMRDGIRLNTEIYVPKNATGPLPFIMERTPYSIGHDDKGFARSLSGPYKELVDDGYIFVFQDIRGKFKSDGQFVMNRPPRSGAEKVDEGTDASDTIDWLLKNVPGNNGRAGMLGVSYGGWLTMMALVEPNPALKAAAPQASPDDMWMGDDFHHNGAFRLSYGFEYVAMLEAGKDNVPFTFDRADTYDWFLRLGGLSNADEKYFKGQRPTWTEFVGKPDFDEYWKRRKVSPYFATKPVTVPTLTVGGWWDQEDFYGPQTIYAAMEKNDTKGINYLVLGPWNHGGWARGEGSSLGPLKFESPTSQYYRQVQAKWFAYWLKDQGKLDLPEALTFRPGANQWERHDSWPPKTGVTKKNLYFQDGGRLSFDQPTGPSTRAFDTYVSDPARPVPYRQRPINPLYGGKVGSTWPLWLVDDQRFAHMRPDVLSWETEPLTEDVTISGQVFAKLFASSSGTDADWIAKLIDVYPEDYPADPKMAGYQLMVSNDVFRSRYRKSFDKPIPLVPNQVTEITIDLHGADYAFKPGHKIMVQVQSTWFPLIDRNPQRYVPNIYLAKDSDFIPATQRVFRSAQYPSHVEVSVVNK